MRTCPRSPCALFHTDPLPYSQREWAIGVSAAQLRAIIHCKLKVNPPRELDLVDFVMGAIEIALRQLGVCDTYHDASEAFQELVVAIMTRSEDVKPVFDLPGYIFEASRRQARRVIKRSRCAAELTDKNGNRRYVNRRKELTPELVASLTDQRHAEESFHEWRKEVADRAMAGQPATDRLLHRLYREAIETMTAEQFVAEYKEFLSLMGIDTLCQFRHRIYGINQRLRALGEVLADA